MTDEAALLRARVRSQRDTLLANHPPFRDWPAPPSTHPFRTDADQRTYLNRKFAMQLYTSGEPEAKIVSVLAKAPYLHRLKQGELWTLYQRCVAQDLKTGHVNGAWALVPGWRSGLRKRGRELQGLFEEHPEIEGRLCLFIQSGDARPGKVNAVTHKNLHAFFLRLCKQQGLDKAGAWPFRGSDRFGYEALRRWCKTKRHEFPSKAAVASLGDDAGKLVARDHARVGQAKVVPPLQLFARTELDEHKLDSLVSALVPAGFEGSRTFIQLPASRMWLLGIVEYGCKLLLASGTAFKERYDRQDVLRLAHRALRPPPRFKRLHIDDPEYRYADESCFPGELPEFAGNTWQQLAFDSDSAHLAPETLKAIEDVTGCLISAEATGQPERRSIIEGFFKEPAHWASFLPSATGNHPGSPFRRGAATVDGARLVVLPFVEEWLDLKCRNYNVTPQQALHGLSPLQKARLMLARDEFFRSPLGDFGLHNLFRLLPSFRANLTQRRAANVGVLVVNCQNATYTSAELNADMSELLYTSNRGVTVYIEQDARLAVVVPDQFPDRAYKVAVTAPRHRAKPHSLLWRSLTASYERHMKHLGHATLPNVDMAVLQGLASAAVGNRKAAEAAADISRFISKHVHGEIPFVAMSKDDVERLLDGNSRFSEADDLEEEGGAWEGEQAPGLVARSSESSHIPARKDRPLGL